jgi:signal peptidase II
MRLRLLFLMLLVCVGCDQTTKYTAKELLPPDRTISLAADTIRLAYIENHGAFLGLGASLSAGLRFGVFVVSVSIGLVVMFIYLVSSRTLHWLPAMGLSFILGGGISNLIDRLAYEGAVVDFVNVGIGSLRTGVFNMADVAIVVGSGLLVLYAFVEGRQEGSGPSPDRRPV